MSTGGLRASDRDRDAVAQVLQTAYAEGRISFEEHSERTEALLRAKTFDDLTALTEDLVVLAPPAPPRSGTVATTTEPERVTAVLSETKRVGPWQVGRALQANVFMGSAVLDLTDATFEAPLVEISVTQLMGSLKIRLPLGSTVQVDATNVLAESTVKGLGAPRPGAPTVVVRGTNVMGEIQVRGPKKPLPWRRHVP